MDTSQSRAARSGAAGRDGAAVGAERHVQGHSTLVVGSRCQGPAWGSGMAFDRPVATSQSRAERSGLASSRVFPSGLKVARHEISSCVHFAQDPAAGQILDPGRPAGIGHGREAVGTEGRGKRKTVTLHSKALERPERLRVPKPSRFRPGRQERPAVPAEGDVG